MKKIASWIVATHFRPELLWCALMSIHEGRRCPPEWHHEVIVVHHVRDTTAPEVVNQIVRMVNLNAHAIETREPTGGGKRTVGLRAAQGELVLAADDDDIQSPNRLMNAINAYDAGCAISEIREFRYLHLESGAVVRWCGGGDAHRPPVTVGTARNYRRSMLQKAGGWKPLPRLIEKDLQARLAARFPGKASRAHVMTLPELQNETICIQHGANIWDDRPVVPIGKVVDRGAFRLVGEGHWSQVPNFPFRVAELLALRR